MVSYFSTKYFVFQKTEPSKPGYHAHLGKKVGKKSEMLKMLLLTFSMVFLFKIQNSFSVPITVSRKVIESYAGWKEHQEVPHCNCLLKAASLRRSDHVAWGFLQTGLEKLQGRRPHSLCGQPAPHWTVLMQKFSLYIQSKLLNLWLLSPALLLHTAADILASSSQ